jgi:hypothetical protein
MSFDPVEVGRLLPWSARLLYIGAVVSVVLAAFSIAARLRDRQTAAFQRVRRSSVTHLALLVLWALCCVLTAITYVREWNLFIPRSPAKAGQAREIHEYLARGLGRGTVTPKTDCGP